MLSNEPPDEACGGAVGCCGAVTTGVTGAAGWEKTKQEEGARVFGILNLQDFIFALVHLSEIIQFERLRLKVKSLQITI